MRVQVAALMAAESGRDGAEAAGPDHGRTPENAGHLTTASASGRFDSEASTESRVCTVDRVDRGLFPAAAGRGVAEL